MIFPRFYFLSNAELLDIIAENKNPDTVQVILHVLCILFYTATSLIFMILYFSSILQPHLVKCFANIRKLYIRSQEQRPSVVLMLKSAEGEILLLPKYVVVVV